jgi:hypothetical protein
MVKAWLAGNLSMLALIGGAQADELKVQFNRDIRPILSENCYTCHGPDASKRKAKLRLDRKEGAFAELGAGRFAVVAGKPDESSLYQRVSSTNDKRIMPPAATGKKLTPDQVSKLKAWIDQGAVWQEHWAFIAPVAPSIPAVKNKTWARNAVDTFILNRLEQDGLQPSPEAGKESLIRRLTFNLMGLPPSIADLDVFLADASPDAYDRLVERLMRSPQYGEHMARLWLDGARYGDTHGLHLDNERSIWPYRDWVIQAFNDNKPFDRFTIEQIAGDMLPQPTRDQLVATGFNRCNVSTSEGGAIPDEFAARYAVDRVETFSTVWMGLTTGCAACHDHKYDPIAQKEFYQLYAFYNSLDEDPMDGNALNHPPVISLPTPEQEAKLAKYDREADTVRRVIQAGLAAVNYEDPLPMSALANYAAREFVWVDDALPEGAETSKDAESWQFVQNGPVYSGDKAHLGKADKTGQHFFTKAQNPLRVGKGDRLFAYVYLDPQNPPKTVMLQFNTDGWDHRAYWGEDLIAYGTNDTPGHRLMGPLPEIGRWVRLEIEAGKLDLKAGSKIHGLAFTQYGGTVHWDKAGIVSKYPQAAEPFDSLVLWDAWQRELENPGLPEPVKQAVKTEPDKRNTDQQRVVREYFIENIYAGTKRIFEPLHEQMAKIVRERQQLDASIPRTYITRELKQPRPAYLLKRGQYDMKGDQVFADVPAILPRLPKDAPHNRLSLAQWLVDPKHPLTARVTVNRFWHYHFGTGLVKTVENFGSQGDSPSHPELLDWLATEFIASGWDVKHLQRLIVTSAAFRQSSAIRPDLLDKDPENRLIARGPRFRLDAETIRDSALAESGLLIEKIGGHGVHPYQPEGIWEAVAYPTSTTAKFAQDSGDALYRRSLYTFWKRTAPPPTMMIFDTPSRESCRVRRERTNTPLQSLALLNDIQYVEAARQMACRLLREGGKTVDQRIGFAFRLATARLPDPTEYRILRDLFQKNMEEFQAHADAAAKLIQVGESKPPASMPPVELAAWTMVANAILNLSETISNN